MSSYFLGIMILIQIRITIKTYINMFMFQIFTTESFPKIWYVRHMFNIYSENIPSLIVPSPFCFAVDMYGMQLCGANNKEFYRELFEANYYICGLCTHFAVVWNIILQGAMLRG